MIQLIPYLSQVRQTLLFSLRPFFHCQVLPKHEIYYILYLLLLAKIVKYSRVYLFIVRFIFPDIKLI
jgi:hypothetical protein